MPWADNNFFKKKKTPFTVFVLPHTFKRQCACANCIALFGNQANLLLVVNFILCFIFILRVNMFPKLILKLSTKIETLHFRSQNLQLNGLKGICVCVWGQYMNLICQINLFETGLSTILPSSCFFKHIFTEIPLNVEHCAGYH